MSYLFTGRNSTAPKQQFTSTTKDLVTPKEVESTQGFRIQSNSTNDGEGGSYSVSTSFYHGSIGRHGQMQGNPLFPGTGTGNGSADFSVWSSDIWGEGSAIGLNGDTIMMVSPIDNGAINYFDEDGYSNDMGGNTSNILAFTIGQNGAVTATCDERCKANIVALDWGDTLAKLAQLQPISYTIARPDHVTRQTDKYDVLHYSFTAQNVQQVFPEFVKEQSSGFLSLQTTSLLLPTIQGVQKLNEKVTALEARIAALESK